MKYGIPRNYRAKLIHHMIVTNMLINEWIPMDCRRMSCIMSKEKQP